MTPAPAATPAPPAPEPAADDLAAQVDRVMALVDSALAANAQQIDRTTLEQIKSELETLKQRVKR